MGATVDEKNPMQAEALKEHAWLAKLAGEWTFEGEVSPGSGQELERAAGAETVRTLGELWTLFEGAERCREVAR